MTTREDTEQSAADIASAAVGKKYEKLFEVVPSAPWLDDLPDWRQSLAKNEWTRWDGDRGTAQQHMAWVREQVKSLFHTDRASEFRPYGQSDGCQFYIHDGLTKEGGGYGFFKIEGREFNLQPRDILRICFDMPKTVDLDATCVFYKLMKAYTIDLKGGKTKKSLVFPVYWCNDPGFPFWFRDGIDLTGFMNDDEPDSKVIWQLAVGVTIDGFGSHPRALKATDRYWAYRLEPTGNGGTKVSIICQCCLNGWIPRFLSNHFVCKVLTDSLGNLEKKVAEMKADDMEGYERTMKEMGLGEW